MATNKQTTTKEQPAKKTQPAKEKPATDTGVGIKELSAVLGRSPKSVRAAIRRLRGGPQVGQGGRYRWDSVEDPDFKELVTALTKGTDTDSE
jgi:hypothetical protein